MKLDTVRSGPFSRIEIEMEGADELVEEWDGSIPQSLSSGLGLGHS